jgi:hypothetical protein
VDYVDIGATGRYTSNIEEEDMVLSESHHRFVVAWIWSLLNIHPFDGGAIGRFQKTHVQTEQLSMRQRI